MIEARYSGALLAIESAISLSGQTVMSNNTASAEGGGVYLRQSTLELYNKSTIYLFLFGGGIHAIFYCKSASCSSS